LWVIGTEVEHARKREGLKSGRCWCERGTKGETVQRKNKTVLIREGESWVTAEALPDLKLEGVSCELKQRESSSILGKEVGGCVFRGREVVQRRLWGIQKKILLGLGTLASWGQGTRDGGWITAWKQRPEAKFV